MTKRFLINASNLFSGGAVQVATSFIAEIADMPTVGQYDLLLSNIVYQNCKHVGVNFNNFNDYKIVDNIGMRSIFGRYNLLILGYDAVFTVFGPLYTLLKPANSLIGFAQPNIIYPEISKSILGAGLKWWVSVFKFWVQKLFYSRADVIVVELEHVESSLRNIKFFSSKDIRVVNNAVNGYYSLVSSTSRASLTGEFHIGYLSKFYPHKNFEFFISLIRAMDGNYFAGKKIYFHFSLDQRDFLRLGFDAYDFCINHGNLRVDQCIDFYNKIDCVLFPSLLECFSATPLEALMMLKPLLAIDRPYVRDVVSDYAFYFDASDPNSALQGLKELIENQVTRDFLDRARNHAVNFSSSTNRALSYVRLIEEASEKYSDA